MATWQKSLKGTEGKVSCYSFVNFKVNLQSLCSFVYVSMKVSYLFTDQGFDSSQCRHLSLRRYLGYRKTILLNRKAIVEQIDRLRNSTINMHEFSLEIRRAHEDRTGTPFIRRQIPGLPKEEDYFYANPQECLCAPESSFSSRKRLPSHVQFYS